MVFFEERRAFDMVEGDETPIEADTGASRGRFRSITLEATNGIYIYG